MAAVGKFRETGWSAYGLSRARRYHIELSWFEVDQNASSVVVFYTAGDGLTPNSPAFQHYPEQHPLIK